MKKYITSLLTAVFLMTALFGATVHASAAADEKLNIVATIFPLYDFSRAIAGDKAEVTMLLKPGAEIHSFDPSPADMIKIQNADVFLYVGGESDVWVDEILSSMDISNKQIIRLMDAVTLVNEETVEGMQEEEEHHHEGEAAEDGQDHEDEDADDDHEHEEAEYDEHIWTSPKNAVQMVNAIADAMMAADEANKDTYKENADAYTTKIQAVDQAFEAVVSQAAHHMLVFGDRFPFRYFADAYKLEYRAAFPGCSTETEASAATLAYLIDTVKAQGLPYIYTIELSNGNIARSISEQTGAQVLTLQSCQGISRDAFDAGETYVTLMEQNVEALKKGLVSP